MPYSDLRHVFDEQKPQQRKKAQINISLVIKLSLLLSILAGGYWYSKTESQAPQIIENQVESKAPPCDEKPSTVCALINNETCNILPCPLEKKEFTNHCKAKEAKAFSIEKGSCVSTKQEEKIKEKIRIVDGDTFDLSGKRIRLYGIDAVELNQHCFDQYNQSWPCGIEAKKRLSQLLDSSDIQCEELTKDIYGRSIASCTNKGGDIAKSMVFDGYAVAYRKYSSKYIKAEQQAKKGKKGIWKGRFVLPNKWRKAQYKMN